MSSRGTRNRSAADSNYSVKFSNAHLRQVSTSSAIMVFFVIISSFMCRLGRKFSAFRMYPSTAIKVSCNNFLQFIYVCENILGVRSMFFSFHVFTHLIECMKTKSADDSKLFGNSILLNGNSKLNWAEVVGNKTSQNIEFHFSDKLYKLK